MLPSVDLLTALLALQKLEHLPRTGWCQRGIDPPESIAAHVAGVSQVALALAPRVAPAISLGRVLTLVTVHDAPEALLGDLPRTAKKLLPNGAKAEAEERAADELLGALSPEARDAFREYVAGETREARFAQLCDRLQLGLRLLAYLRSGRRGLDDFVAGLERLDAPEFAPCEELREALCRAVREALE